MTDAVREDGMAAVSDRDHRLVDVVSREQSRLRRFIRRRMPDAADAEDILQDVFAELVEANRRLMPIDHVTGWLFRVARNRITDVFRKRRPEAFADLGRVALHDDEGGEGGEDRLGFEALLPSPDAGPEALYARQVLLDALEAALDELPAAQRWVFMAHEWDGRSFKALSAESGVGVNTLLSRKRYAVRHLRERLQRVWDDFTSGQGTRP